MGFGIGTETGKQVHVDAGGNLLSSKETSATTNLGPRLNAFDNFKETTGAYLTPAW